MPQKKKKLTPAQTKYLPQVRKLLAGGKDPSAIAAELGIGDRALQFHLTRYRQLGLLTREQTDPRRRARPARPELPAPVAAVEQAQLDQKIMEYCKLRPRSLGELSTLCDRSKASIEEALKRLHARGLDIGLKADTKKVELELGPGPRRPTMNLTGALKQHYRIGIAGDTQLGSKFQQITLLRSAYEEFDRQDVDCVLNPGDLVDGIKMYKGHEYELFLHSADEQRDYVVKNYPRLKNGKKTYIIGGNHDASFKKTAGYNIVRDICAQRADLAYAGDIGANFSFGNVRICMTHPDGGVAYALTYKPQKHAESVMSSMLAAARQTHDFSQLPHILILGHWHVWAYLPAYQGMMVISAPCFQSQTGYLKAKGLQPQVGFMIMDIWLDKDKNLLKATHQDFDLSTKVIEQDF